MKTVTLHIDDRAAAALRARIMPRILSDSVATPEELLAEMVVVAIATHMPEVALTSQLADETGPPRLDLNRLKPGRN
jgi:hypothetical protein